MECAGCRDHSSTGIRLPITPGMLEAMHYITTCDAKKLFSFQVGEETIEQLASVTESYLTTQLERGFSTLDFYKEIF